MNPRLLVGSEVWQAIRQLNESRSSSVTATVVVSFFGKGGSEILPLRPGDAIWVGATLENVKAGLVNPYELLEYPVGVRVFRVSHLHAELFCFGNRVIISSGNVSKASCETLIEAGIKLVLPKKTIEKMLDKIEKELLSRDDLKALRDFYRPPRAAARKLLDSQAPVAPLVRTKEPRFSDRIWYHGAFRLESAMKNTLNHICPH